jgi:hypothetical protein
MNLLLINSYATRTLAIFGAALFQFSTAQEFRSNHGNTGENLWLARNHAAGKAAVSRHKITGYFGGGVNFIHEWNGYICFYSGSSVTLNKDGDSSQSKVIGALPFGRSILFEDKKIYMTLQTGPTVIWDDKFATLAEGITIPHSGHWASVLAMYPDQNHLYIVNSLNSPAGHSLYTNTVKIVDTAMPAKLELSAKTESSGPFYQSLQFKDQQILTTDKGFHFAKMDGTILSSHFKKSPIRFGAVSPDGNVFGAFGNYQGKWSYLEFDSEGKLGFHLALARFVGAGSIVFDNEGNRFLYSKKELLKIGQKDTVEWTHGLKPEKHWPPAVLVFGMGNCAFVNAGNFVILNSDGTEAMAVPVEGKAFTAPPYLSRSGQFYLGLSNDSTHFLRVDFKP